MRAPNKTKQHLALRVLDSLSAAVPLEVCRRWRVTNDYIWHKLETKSHIVERQLIVS